MTHELSERELAAMRHAVGAGVETPRAKHGYRNHYVAGTDSDRDRLWKRLVSIGYAVEHDSSDTAGTTSSYTVTREGCAAIGLSKAATIRACGSEAEQRAQRAARDRQRDARLKLARVMAEGAALAAIREAKRSVAKARRAINRAMDLGVTRKSWNTIERRMDEAVSQ